MYDTLLLMLLLLFFFIIIIWFVLLSYLQWLEINRVPEVIES